MRTDRLFLLSAVWLGLLTSIGFGEPPVDFNRDIRPILIQHCTGCHGGVKQAGDVSFVYAESVLPPDGWIIEPGDPDASILIERITTDDPDIRMPPPHEHPEPLPAEHVQTLRKWIKQGAAWGKLWSMGELLDGHRELTKTTLPESKLSKTTLPESKLTGASRAPLDDLVDRERRTRGLSGAGPAPPAQWLRRATLDLTGLPPTMDEVDQFLAECDSAATPAARDRVYARQVDRLLASHHFGGRWASVWMDLARYADSKGFEKDPHRDMWPYRDWLANAFNADMPYDQFTIKQLAGDLIDDASAGDLIATAFHRNTQTNTEGGTDDEEFRVAAIIDRVNTTWTVWQATTMGCVQCHSHPYDEFEHDEYYRSMALFDNSLDADLDDDYPTLTVPAGGDAETSFRLHRESWQAARARNDFGRSLAQQVAWQAIAPESVQSSGGTLEIVGDEVRTASGTFPPGVRYTVELPVDQTISAIRIDIKPRDGDDITAPERGSVLSELKADWVDGETVTPLTFSDVFADSLTQPGDPRDALKPGRDGVGEFPKLTGPRWAVFVLDTPIDPQSLESKTGRLRLTMVQSASTSGNIAAPVRRFVWSSTDQAGWIGELNSPRFAELTDALVRAKRAADGIRGAEVPVIRSRPESAARTTRVFIRGNWMERGDAVSPGIPAVFQGDRPIVADDRLDFARWLVSPDNPLAARVWANRIWAQLFGLGLAETQEDFGSSGLPPSNRGLLDHLALRLRDRHDWHLKPFLRELVLSTTYRQTHAVSAQHHATDPRNEFLTRGPRTRLSAEMVRDQALAASGLLADQIGGPSVMPPQPDGVWQAVYSGAQWKTSEGDQRYRRAIYTYWRRTSPYPSFLTFDSPTRDLCSARRIATNTPLQALVTMNDPVYQECGDALARAAANVCGDSVEHAIGWMHRSVTSQMPSDFELDELMNLYNDLRSPSAPQNSVDDGAMSIVANTILNLDKALTK